MTAEERKRLQRAAAVAARRAIEPETRRIWNHELAQGVINSAAYSGAADPEKAYMLKYVYSYADHIAKYEVNNDYSLAKWEMAAYKSANPMQAIIDHAREYYNPDKEN